MYKRTEKTISNQQKITLMDKCREIHVKPL